MAKVLIVDDQTGMRRSLEIMLRKEGHQAYSTGDGQRAASMVAELAPDLLLLDLCMEPLSGLEVLKAVRAAHDDLPRIVMMTAYATVETAVTAMKLGADDYVTKPFCNEQIVAVIAHVLERERRGRATTLSPRPTLVGNCAAMRQVLRKIEQVSATNLTVLITGETGTGKTAVARAIHSASARAVGPFVHINCAGIPDTLLEAELFGHEKGAFTGAVASRRGLFEEASGGTIFLDEIALMPVALQSKLLTVLEDRKLRRVGGNKPIHVDARVIAATNSDLREQMNRGQFRQDLFFRLSVARLELPPLRDRREDLRELTAHIVAELCPAHGKKLELSHEAFEALLRYHFPGNIRELTNALAWACAVARPPMIERADLPDEIAAPAAIPNEPSRPASLAMIEQSAIVATIEQHHGNLTKAARTLGIGRTTLWRRLRNNAKE